ncbi:FecR family protein [Asticcacaulis machinosus]|uniref:FecR domain-containing protein n=1 Tax=Asticcacaulis machinosus TaxID=2984211 RepID=A0ABT5HMU9_9CAUL|nr:FecR domain-containing protein [Asticcacaulis machinosus]MDC7677471.1 FecR domain-containing protein [Asticcacaulis machinosus]
MIKVVNDPKILSVEDEAAAWVVAMMAESVPAHTERQFELWITANPDHAQAYADLSATWKAPSVAEATATVKRQRQGRSHLAIILGGAIAACLVLGFVSLNTKSVGLPAFKPQPTYSASLMTGPGDIQDVALPDGTRIALSGNSALTVQFLNGRRQVELTRGEAWFDVAHDEGRPFHVAANDTDVKVVGTAFNIDTVTGDITEISVYRGKVQVAVGKAHTDLTPGLKLISHSGRSEVTRFDAAQTPDWRDGWYEAEDIELGRLIAEVNRFAKVPVKIADPDLAAKTVSGRFKVSDPALVLSGLKQVYGINVQADETVTVLTK